LKINKKVNSKQSNSQVPPLYVFTLKTAVINISVNKKIKLVIKRMRNSKSTQATTEINKIQKTKIELQLKMNPRQMPNKKDLDFDFIIIHILSHSNQIKFNIIR